MQATNNQNIFDFTLENFGTLESLFDDVLVPNSLSVNEEVKINQEININTVGKGNETIKNSIQEQGLILTNGEIQATLEAEGIGVMIIGTTFTIT